MYFEFAASKECRDEISSVALGVVCAYNLEIDRIYDPTTILLSLRRRFESNRWMDEPEIVRASCATSKGTAERMAGEVEVEVVRSKTRTRTRTNSGGEGRSM